MGQKDKQHAKRRNAKQCFTISEKSIMGGYFNIARLNFFKTIITVFTQAGIKGVYGEEKIDKVLDALYKVNADMTDKLYKEQKDWIRNLRLKKNQMVKLQRLLFKFFPILGPIMASEASYKVYSNKKSNIINDEEMMRGVTLEDCLKVIATLSACLTDCRNFYSHYNPYNNREEQIAQLERQEAVARWLDKVIVASRRIDKQRNSLTSNELEFLTGIDHFLPKDKLDENGQKIIVKGKPMQEFVEYPDYYFRIRGTRHLIDATGKEQTDDSRNALTDFGVVFFCTIFLQKTYAKQMLEELELFENGPYDGTEEDDEKKNAILREMLSIYRIRVPRGKRLDSKDDATTLAMDILNELRKCPLALYDVLDKKGQQFFEDEVRRPNERTPEKSKRLRSTDRFPYLVLKYIDQQELFSRIRFQMQLGSYRFKFYDKKTIDGSDEVRSLQKEINGYGRLQEIEKKRKEVYASIMQKSEMISTKLEYEDLYLDLAQFDEDKVSTQPYITNHSATYNIHSNRIGMYWEENQNKKEYKLFSEDGMYLPTLNTVDGKAPIKMPAPKASLSVYDLPALMFYQYLLNDCKADKKEYDGPQEIIIKKQETLSKLFKAIADGTLKPLDSEEVLACKLENDFQLTLGEVPEKMIDYLSGKKDYSSKKVNDFAQHEVLKRFSRSLRRLEHFKEDRKMIGEKNNKYGKKSYVDVRHGRLAQYLAESIMDWRVPVEGKGDKLTGLNYSKMQAFLATYGHQSTLSELTQLLTSAQLLGEGAGSHPFIKKVLDKCPQNIEMLYLTYLKEEVEKLKTFLVIKYLEEIPDQEKKKHKDMVVFTAKEKRRTSDGKTMKVTVEKTALKLVDNTNFKELPFIHHQRERFKLRDTEYYRSLAARYLAVDGRDATIQLPDGLFTPYILKLLKDKYAAHEVLQMHLQDEQTNHNAAYLISSFFESVLGDSSQPYYKSFKLENGEIKPGKFAHIYDLFNILNNVKKANVYDSVPMTTDNINTRLTQKAVDQSGLVIIRKDENGDDYIVKQITIEIEKHLKAMEASVENRIIKSHLYGYKASNARKNGIEEREKMKQYLAHCIGEVKRNERIIRRYKTQDMVLFLMAKNIFLEILSQQNGEANELFLLKNVCDSSFLSQTVKFSFPITVDNYTIKVVQENMALKNYGEFYRFLNDDRLQSLLKQMKGVTEVSHADLTGELANYDQRRSKVFKMMQQLEKIAFEYHQNELTDTSNPKFFKDGEKGEIPKRNNFRSLISLFEDIEGNQLTAADCERLVEIRNAFCHNTYRMDISDTEKALPTIAIQILGIIENLLKDAKRDKDK